MNLKTQWDLVMLRPRETLSRWLALSSPYGFTATALVFCSGRPEAFSSTLGKFSPCWKADRKLKSTQILFIMKAWLATPRHDLNVAIGVTQARSIKRGRVHAQDLCPTRLGVTREILGLLLP